MADIHISSVSNDETVYNVLITLVETKVEKGETVYAPLGEAVVSFPKSTEMSKIEKQIIKAAQGIMKAHQDSLDKKTDLEQVDWPFIS